MSTSSREFSKAKDFNCPSQISGSTDSALEGHHHEPNHLYGHLDGASRGDYDYHHRSLYLSQSNQGKVVYWRVD